MQIYALDDTNQLIAAASAQKQKDYLCTECRGKVRVRLGTTRRPHFYHLNPPPDCRLGGKSLTHLQIQYYFQQQLGSQNCELEKQFSEIRRIADVAWLPQKIVFEIQYSPISKKEVLDRIQDYRSVGWNVIWVLHEVQFNQKRISSAELGLYNYTHYYTNIDDSGIGIVYDQFSIFKGSIREKSIGPVELDIRQIIENRSQIIDYLKPYPLLHKQRARWLYSFRGDLSDRIVTLIQKGSPKDSFDETLESFLLDITETKSWQDYLQIPIYFIKYLIEICCYFYRSLFHLILEKRCK
ncbi:MAG: putative transcription factor [Chlamydiales bacterium]|jgi:competence protein CoiA|nr:putative transcription factor [Chlamydiales bacterium]